MSAYIGAAADAFRIVGKRMTGIESYLFWLTIFSYVTAFCVLLAGFMWGKLHGAKTTAWILSVGFCFHTALGIARWLTGGHPPVTDAYELNLTGTWLGILLFLIFVLLRRSPPVLGLVVIPLTFLVLGHGYIQGSAAVPMGAAFRSPWLIVHVVFAWLAFGSYAISTGAAVFLLLRKRLSGWKGLEKVPATPVLDLVGYRFVTIGFINHAVMLASGAIWAKKLWGHYWNWDALETWSLISFLVYAFILHARAFLGWKGARAAWLTIFGLGILGISFWGVSWFSPSIHPGP